MSRRGIGNGRKSKGDRHAVMTRLPRADADWLMDEADARDLSYSEFLAACVARARADEAFLPDLDEGRLFVVPPP